MLVFTSEEVWGTRYPEAGSVHLLEWPVLPTLPEEDAGAKDLDGANYIEQKWGRVRAARAQVTEAIEPLRREKIVRSSLEAEVVLGGDTPVAAGDHSDIELAEIFISGTVRQDQSIEGIAVTPTTNHKCGRCWRHLPEVETDGSLCNRCDTVLTSA